MELERIGEGRGGKLMDSSVALDERKGKRERKETYFYKVYLDGGEGNNWLIGPPFTE
jgi:hypothetical protein